MTDTGSSLSDRTPVPRRSQRQSATISMSWSSVAFGAGAVALASTSSLAIVATMSKADALATVALALAILSFIIQIGLFIAQSWTSGQQVLHSEELNSDTRAILAEVRENARGTNQMISDQFEKVLTHLLDTTKRTVDESIKGPEAEILNERLGRELRNTLRVQLSESAWPQVRRVQTAEERRELALLRSYPSDPEEMAESEAALKNLSPKAVIDLNSFAEDEIRALRSPNGITRGLFKSLVRNVDELLDAGLVKRTEVPIPWRDQPQYTGQDYFVLTDKGRRIARVLNSRKSSSDQESEKLPESNNTDMNNEITAANGVNATPASGDHKQA